MKELDQNVQNRVNAWLEGNYDEEAQADIRKMLDEEKYDELTDAFYKDLEFGTGGLRGIMGVGTNRVNRYTLGMATQGLSNYLKKVYPDDEISVAIAHDSRNNATIFARVVADVFSANGIKVFYFESLRPTPELSFAIRELGCKSGVMLTASHNPKEYSGYKAYWDDGCQVLPPHDKNIIREVQAIESVDQVNFEGDEDLIELIGPDMDEKFIDTVVSTSVNRDVIKKQHDLNIVFSPIHGTAVDIVPRALRKLGFDNVNLVEEQCTIDGDFPTVVYPNPEEEEALSMALEQARESDADLVMATDPDADRVGIAVKNEKGEFELLNGNQTAVLLFHYLLTAWEEAGKFRGNEYIVKTIVTTYLIDKIAASMNVTCYNVLTGFKYIGDLMTKKLGEEVFIAGGEESYGYLVGDHVRDKDAVVSCTMIAEMAAHYKEQGRSLYEALIDVYTEYGFYKEELISLTKKGKKGAEEIKAIMEKLRYQPPSEIAGFKVKAIRDYLMQTEKHVESGRVNSIDFPASNVLQFITLDDYIISARPSGTEPKIKFYISVNGRLDSREEYRQKEKELDQLIGKIRKGLDF
ncbi:phospho-sugar mutase [Rhodohalobacter mucosus]|uniref:Phosphoglucomutase n=1 Tax=Rhodohalobacter mucosus TaxID=2079485 RepID=A0A316TP70_9BACT|nr:phospho-sugar mutase [Rhodohalobacter mucosus]PWN06407.1 phosphoglucomutase [Rhodohalobacter mucosus]